MEAPLDLSGLLPLLSAQPAYQKLSASLASESASTSQSASISLIRPARPYVIASLARELAGPILIVTARVDEAHNMAEQILAWDSTLEVLTFAEPNPIFYERAPWGPRSTRTRLKILSALTRWHDQPEKMASTVIITSARALMQRTIPASILAEQTITMERGKHIPVENLERLLHRWMSIGYEPASVVTTPGTFSRRGGIVDIFRIDAAWPARIELWGDEIESLRSFDPATQRSTHDLLMLRIPPAREALPLLGPGVARQIAGWLSTDASEEDVIEGTPSSDLRDLAQGTSFPTLEFYLPWMYQDSVSLFDHLPHEALIILEDQESLSDTIAELEEQALSIRQSQEQAKEIPPQMPLPFLTWDELRESLASHPTLELVAARGSADETDTLFSSGPRYGGQIRLALESLRKELRTRTNRVIVVSQQANRLADLWYEHGGEITRDVAAIRDLPPESTITFVHGSMNQGWILEGMQGNTFLLTDAEIFGWKRPEPRRRAEQHAIAPEGSFSDLTEGDAAVHAEYGIGIFRGLEKRTINNIEREFLILGFAGGDTLYVPIHQADRLSRYVGRDGEDPTLSRLGSPEWNRVKTRTREDVEQKAEELLALYSSRETIPGHAFGPDTPWQHELEASFPYIETEDQLRALQEVKHDMERPRPMDRLIAGDVGYGKTEVALRAAFKAIMDGKQVAMLVPTTVLAQQHLDTFTRRLAAFPVKVEMLSRFRNRQEQNSIIVELASGVIDIVIGTHRLLGSDVSFRDLGLVIIDEEQRFGVTHKEKLKQMRTEVDVLTLTATPIPRTLYMSLTGVRDISTIVTPPEERLPVTTFVGKRDDNLIRQAILRELDRGGQVFFVHNRVQSIHAEAERLQKLVPEAGIAIGHGQMHEDELEAVMEQFAEGSVDLLACTSIIEAGLDIPNANTLIVDRADLFGLAQLYQLRGRVGRSAARAYAYFFHAPYASLTDDTRARLETISEQTQLGAGMNIAMRDLEIRGAGEILGTRQHGAIAAVGFHLYTQMLAQAVQRRRSQNDGGEIAVGSDQEAARETVTIDLPIATYIPTDYVSDIALRIQLYRRLAEVRSPHEIDLLRSELADRFGPLPLPVENLLYQLQVKILAMRANIESVTSDQDQIAIRLPGLAQADRSLLQHRLNHNVRVSRTAIWLPKGDQEDMWRKPLLSLLDRMSDSHPTAKLS